MHEQHPQTIDTINTALSIPFDPLLLDSSERSSDIGLSVGTDVGEMDGYCPLVSGRKVGPAVGYCDGYNDGSAVGYTDGNNEGSLCITHPCN